MRLRITRALSGSVDGIQLRQFEVGRTYDVGTSLGSYLLCEEFAEPVADESPALVVPFNEAALLTADDRPSRPRRRLSFPDFWSALSSAGRN